MSKKLQKFTLFSIFLQNFGHFVAFFWNKNGIIFDFSIAKRLYFQFFKKFLKK